jgi:hypothetical protein
MQGAGPKRQHFHLGGLVFQSCFPQHLLSQSRIPVGMFVVDRHRAGLAIFQVPQQVIVSIGDYFAAFSVNKYDWGAEGAFRP